MGGHVEQATGIPDHGLGLIDGRHQAGLEIDKKQGASASGPR